MSNNIYYRIWADAILRYKKFHPDRADWKLSLFIQMTWMHTLNWWIIFIWLKFFNILNIPLISIDIFPGTILNNFLSFILEFAFPFGILNYFLIYLPPMAERSRCVLIYISFLSSEMNML
jgi:hypothetical protein